MTNVKDSWVRLSHQCNIKEEVGNKAHNLWQLRQANLAVPNWIAVATSAFEALTTSDDRLSALRNEIHSRCINKVNLMAATLDMQKAILQVSLPDSLIRAVLSALHEAGMEFPLAIRSSAQLEDLPNASHAGAYKTCLDVTEEMLPEAIKACWASLYGPRAVLDLAESSTDLYQTAADLWKKGMAVILQEMIAGEKYGVAFTADPLSGSTAWVTVEAAAVAGDLVSGKDISERFVTLRSTGKVVKIERDEGVEDPLAEALVADVVTASLDAERRFGMPQDVEWVISHGKLYLLQSRPVGKRVVPRAPLDDIRLFRTEEVDMEGRIGFGECTGIQQAYEKKKFPLRRFAVRNDIRLPAWYWLEWDGPSLARTPPNVIEDCFQADYVMIDFSSNLRGMVVRRNEIKPYLLDMVKNHPSHHMTALIRDSFATEVTAISAEVTDGLVMIEYVKGMSPGILSGIAEASRVWVNVNGDIVRQEMNAQRHAVEMDEKTFAAVERQIDPTQTELSPTAIEQINRGTRLIGAEFGESRPEWWVVGGIAYLFDQTLESKPLRGGLNSTLIISPGQVTGYAVVIDDRNFASDLFDGWAASVVGLNKDSITLPSVERLLAKIETAAKRGPIIVVAPNPHIGLAGFLDRFAGCVFESGALLAHLSIVLREREMPAVVLPGAVAEIRDGDFVKITEDGTVDTSRSDFVPSA